MTSIAPRNILIGVALLLLISLGSFSFFLFFINPEYLNFSGFLLFYLTVFFLVWSIIFLIWCRLMRKKRRSSSVVGNIGRHSVLFALLALAALFLAQMRALSFITFIPLLVFAFFAEYLIAWKK